MSAAHASLANSGQAPIDGEGPLPRAGTAARRLAELVEVRGRFHRSVHLARDWDSGFESEFFATPALLAIAEQILGELDSRQGTRAWTVTGPYGAGKSAFALFLARLLASAQPGNAAARALRRQYLKDAPPLLPLLIQAERAPLAPAIAAAVAGAEELRLGRGARGLSERPSACVDLLVEAAERSNGGIALIVDELGKYLEYAAARPEEDVFLLQQLAEAAARSDKPLLFVSVLHSGFGDYVTAGDPARRAEWQKVQGRFRDISFSPPAEQLLELVGHAIERRLPPPLERAYRQRLRAVTGTPGIGEAMSWKGAETSLHGCLPLHPVTALLMWPLFRSKVAQNERSLFAFLSGHEPHGFQEFLRTEEASTQSPPLYRLPRLYDYVTTALGMAACAGEDARFWSLMEHALERLPASAPPVAARLVKCVGLLSLYGRAAGLRPDREVLCAALDDAEPAEVGAVLDRLERESIVLFRRHRRCYGLWEGSDVDLEVAFEQGLAQRGREPLYRRLDRAVHLPALVARGHYIRTGTLRFFEPRLAAPSSRSCEEVLSSPTQADGLVLFLVGDEGETRVAARAGGNDGLSMSRARELSKAISHQRPVLVASPKRALELGEALDELEAWRWVRENVGELAGDAVARGEVAARETTARERFDQVAGRILGLSRHVLDPSACGWFYGGEKVLMERPRDLQQRLSEICEMTYSKAPPLHNELLNRHNLSSAAARARRELIEHMVDHGDEERLGMEGFPPEYSMYRSLLVAGDFHRQPRGRKWRICRPRGAWAPLWGEIEKFVRDSRARRRSLSELIAALEAPPFGLRRGPIPVLIAVLLRIRGARVALYEDGLFEPRVEIETLERLVRRPETFSIRTYSLNRNERLAIQALAAREAAAASPDAGSTAELLPIVRNLVRIASQLPPYARRTRRLSGSARAVRQRLLDARDPRQLLFEELPGALGVQLDSEDGPREFARLLGSAVRELSQALPDLLQEVEDRVAKVLGFEERGAALRKALQEQSRGLLEHARLHKLQLFLNAAARVDGRNLGEWRSALALAIGEGLPPEQWNDELADSVGQRLRALRLELDELGEVVRVKRSHPSVAVGSIRVRMPGTGECRFAFPCASAERARVDSLLREWRAAARVGKHSSGVQKQAVALLARELDAESDDTGEATPERKAS